MYIGQKKTQTTRTFCNFHPVSSLAFGKQSFKKIKSSSCFLNSFAVWCNSVNDKKISLQWLNFICVLSVSLHCLLAMVTPECRKSKFLERSEYLIFGKCIFMYYIKCVLCIYIWWWNHFLYHHIQKATVNWQRKGNDLQKLSAYFSFYITWGMYSCV